MNLVYSSTHNGIISFNNTISFRSISNIFSFLLFSLIGKDLSVNSFEAKVCEICYLAMMLHYSPTKKLETLEVLDELEIRKAIRL